jgi:hypothetical protein
MKIVINDNLKECQNKCICVEERWYGIYTILKNKSFWKVVDYSLAMPVTNAAIERKFASQIFYGRTKKNRFLVPTAKAIIILKNNFKKYSCIDLYDFLLTQQRLLNAISSSKNYNAKGCNEENYEQSTSTQ